MKTKIVLGTMYGDEGKGLVTSHLSEKDDLVVRFNGGHQAGHTVHYGYRHVFSNFGSGTLKGAHTFWSKYCTFYPYAFLNEHAALKKIHANPVFYMDPRAMITTFFDVNENRRIAKENGHGSVGVGFGTTIARNEAGCTLVAEDLTNTSKFHKKLYDVAAFYGIHSKEATEEVERFLKAVSDLPINICDLHSIKDDYENIIFEGAQGIMLDMDFGHFPHVTRSNTTSKNALEIIKECGLPAPEIFYVMRSYATRHGNGPFAYEDSSIKFEDHTNITHDFQGAFRQGFHSPNELRYALDSDDTFSKGLNKNMVITCLNQTDDTILIGSERRSIEEFVSWLDMDNVYLSRDKETINLHQ